MRNIPKYAGGDPIGGLMNNFSGGPWDMVGQAADIASSVLPLKTEYSGDKGEITAGMDSAYDTISNVAMGFGPIGSIVGGAMKAGKLVGGAVNALGGGTDAMTTQDAILGSAFFNLTPMGMINGFGGKKADTFTKDEATWAGMGSSYGGSESLSGSAAWKSGKKYGLFSSADREKANKLIREANRQQSTLTDMLHTNDMTQDVLANQSSLAGYGTAYAQSGGFDAAGGLRAAKEGMKVPFVFDYSCLELPQFKNGGAMNVIPEGALHAHKHHMENDEHITKKGIPVVVEGEGGEISQQAEIERNEIILHYDATKKIEELYKIYYSESSSKKEKDEAAIEAGKYLTEEIINNTDDRTGLMDTIN